MTSSREDAAHEDSPTQMPELHVGRGTSIGPVTVFPVWTPVPPPEDLVMGREAHVDVSELADRPQVGKVLVSNRGPAAALLLEGELLEGGWQHRVLTHDLVLVPGQALSAEVACVEAGRWGGTGDHRRRARRASPSVRAALSMAAAPRRQHEVWQRVARYDMALGTSDTSSLVEHFDRLEDAEGSNPLADLLASVQGIAPLPGQRGVLVGLAGQPMLLELYPSEAALATQLKGLLSGMMLDALASRLPHEMTPGRRARWFVEKLHGLAMNRDAFDAGAGQAMRADAPTAMVRGLQYNDRWAHLTALNPSHPLLTEAIA